MFHVKHLFSAFIILSLSYLSNGQGTYTYRPVNFALSLKEDTAIINRLQLQDDYRKMSLFERQFAYSLNYARRHPRQFSKEALLPYLVAYPNLKPQYGESLVAELAGLASVQLLNADMRLVAIARMHAIDLANHNVMSHQSTDGTTTQQRFEKAGIGCGSECINMANPVNALEVLLSLLIDYNVPNLGHRKSLLNPKMSSVGIGLGTNSVSKLQYTVVDLGCM
ncbi:hypothetical protein BH10BAC3_BH10BAC3_14170 [soil metagenome]